MIRDSLELSTSGGFQMTTTDLSDRGITLMLVGDGGTGKIKRNIF